MKNQLITSLLILLMISSCKNKEETKAISNSETEDSIQSEPEKKEEVNVVKKEIKEFSWDDIQESTVDIGAYPYITPPKGMIVDKNTSATKSYDFDKLEMYDGNSFFVLEGKVERMKIIMDGDKEWQQYFFDKSVSEYLKSIGAKMIYNDQFPYELTQKWGETPNEIYEHMHEFYAGDVVNLPISMYVLKTSNKKIGFQVSSDSSIIGVVEMEDFKQTIEKITADKMLSEINTNGFATLHINFETGKSRIKSESYEIVNEIVKMMKANPDLKISIEGHTDNVGNEESNLKLSKNRARSVLMSLTDENIDESRLQSNGFGASKPVENNATDEGKAKNRRVEIRKI
ncbi:OmpA family protein [Aquimarina sp. 2201CG1-2-11]|uniref:OmpA family protein n=1 Tax=Aquimarina discodermiae TaxID=3231043 RepID=UPI0034618FDB